MILSNLSEYLSQSNLIDSSWWSWIKRHPKDFIETSALIGSVLANSIIAFLTYRLYSANKIQNLETSRQNIRTQLGFNFEQGMQTIDDTTESLKPIRDLISSSGIGYLRNGSLDLKKTLALKKTAQEFSIRLDLYGLDNVSIAYARWLNSMVEILDMFGELYKKANIDEYGQLFIEESTKKDFVDKSNELFIDLDNHREYLYKVMRDYVSIIPVQKK